MSIDATLKTVTGIWTFKHYKATHQYPAGVDVEFKSVPEKWTHSLALSSVEAGIEYAHRMEREWQEARDNTCPP